MERINKGLPSFVRWGAGVTDLHNALFGGFRPLLRTLLLAVALILAMAFVNLVSLVAAKQSQRRLEVARAQSPSGRRSIGSIGRRSSNTA